MSQPQPQHPTGTTCTTLLNRDANDSKVPRSVMWRLLLGLLKSPTSSLASMDDVPLDQVLDCNAGLLKDEVSHYQQLQALYQPHLNQQPSQQHQGEALVTDDNQSQGQDTTTSMSLPLVDPDPLSETSAAVAAAVDPLTAMMMEQQAQETRRQELDLRYRKEKARRNRGLSEPGSKVVVDDVDADGDAKKKVDRETLSIIDKDLQRLPSPNVTEVVEGGISITTTWATPEQQAAWMDALRELLYIFAQENAHMGYRQGMHEVASYLWLVLVLDRQRQLAVPATANDPSMLALAFDRPAAYTMLRYILGHVRQAFDVKVASNSRPLEDMSHSIMFKIQQYYHHSSRPDRLSPLLRSLSVPPQLYCTKWIRLLFSREVVGASSVLLLWGVFVQLVSEGWEWMAILETTAASRILLCQEALLSKPDGSTAAHHHGVMDLLMNMPPLDNIEPLVQQVNELLELQKYHQLHPELVTIGVPDEMAMHPHIMPQYQTQQQQHDNPLGFVGKRGVDLFNLQAVRQSLGQGVERLSSSSDTWKKKLEEGWNGLKQHPLPRSLQQQRQHDQQSFMMDPSMFGELDGIGAAAVAPPAPINLAQSQYGIPAQQNQMQQQRLQHQLPAAHSPVFGQGHGAMNGSDPMMPIHASGQTASSLPPPPPHGAVNRDPLQSQQQQQQQQHQNHQLAYRLGNSAAVLQDFVMSVARTPDPQQYQQGLNSFYQNGGLLPVPTKVPNAVWEALAEVEAVRSILLQTGPH